MKKLILLLLLSSPALLFGQDRFTEVSSDIEEVQLFLQGAQVTRKATSPLKEGITRLVFTGITSQLDPSSIRVSARNQVVILSVTSRNTIQSNPKKAPIIHMLEDSLQLLNYQLEQEKNSRFVLEQQESLLLLNKELKGDKGLVLIDLEDALIIYQKQLTQIKQAQLDSRVNEKRLTERIRRMNAQLQEFRLSNQMPSYEVVVTVSTASASMMESFELSYFVQEATWVANYDIRVDDLKKPVKLHYIANIYNNTGENWDNVKLSLSSANPNLGGVAPVLHSQRLSFGWPEVVAFYDSDDAYDGLNSFRGNTYKVADNLGYIEEDSVTIKTFTQKNTSFSFDIPTRMKVAANNQAQRVDLIQHNLTGSFQHFTVPKLEDDAFLISKITGWEELNLLVGESNIYFEGTFLGTTVIDPTITTDTLSISLGRDEGVVVQREKLKEFCSSNFSGSKKKEILVYEITVRNTKKEAISIIIEDQVPLASNKEISVEVTNISGATYTELDGKLSWQQTIPAGGTVKLRIEYEVKYPKDKILNGL